MSSLSFSSVPRCKREECKRRAIHTHSTLSISPIYTRLFILQSLVCLVFNLHSERTNAKKVNGKCVFRWQSPAMKVIIKLVRLWVDWPEFARRAHSSNDGCTRVFFLSLFLRSSITIQSDAINYPNSSTILYVRKRIITNGGYCADIPLKLRRFA